MAKVHRRHIFIWEQSEESLEKSFNKSNSFHLTIIVSKPLTTQKKQLIF